MLARVKGLFKRAAVDKDANTIRLRRRQALVSLVSRRLPFIRLALFVIGYTWIIVLPYPRLGRDTYVDENALQPDQVNTYWNWGDVHRADIYLEQLEKLRDTNATSEQRADFLFTEFRKLGLPASTQNYLFSANTGNLHGSNAYAILSSPRASGNEAMVISASWLSSTGDGDGTLNLRGISTVLALAAFLKRYSLWAKDLVFVVSDGYLDGMHAWLSSYHGSVQLNLEAERLVLSSGVIWTALNIDYPGHSFSNLGVFFHGLNGRLPNQDLFNSFSWIAQRTSSVSVVLYDHLVPQEFGGVLPDLEIIPSWVTTFVRDHAMVQQYAYQAKNVIKHVGYQARGRASGVHGLLHQFRIDAITVFAVPASGPHGFYAIGRIIESTLRTTNNLLERLHASFFFYIQTNTMRFLKIGSFLPSVVLISVAMMFGGLKLWVDARWVHGNHTEKGEMRRRPVMQTLGVMMATHVLGLVLFWVVSRSWFLENRTMLSPCLFFVTATLPLCALLIPPFPNEDIAPISFLLKSLNLCLASTVISIITVLNFSLAASLAVSLGIPLSLSSSKSPWWSVKFTVYGLLGLGWLILPGEEMMKAIWNWEILGVWFAPFVCIVYTPLVMQAAIVCLLPP